ncbi:hypothetical protein HZA57_09340 [Candidatus Poribacteria bacterium]|nr:hypothetical protein [Candidatus Poribacteria bacterium]
MSCRLEGWLDISDQEHSDLVGSVAIEVRNVSATGLRVACPEAPPELRRALKRGLQRCIVRHPAQDRLISVFYHVVWLHECQNPMDRCLGGFEFGLTTKVWPKQNGEEHRALQAICLSAGFA